MWCVLAGARKEARLDPSVDGASGTLVRFPDLPERERAIAACAFRDYLLSSICLDTNYPVPGWLDLGRGIREPLQRYGCGTDSPVLRQVHLVAKDFYAYGTLHTKPLKEVRVPVSDAGAFARACTRDDPSLGEIATDCGGVDEAMSEIVARYGRLMAISRYDVALDDAFSVRGNLAAGACGGPSDSNVASLSAFLRGASHAFSAALFPGFRDFKRYFEAQAGERELGDWLEENRVEIYMRGQAYSLRATRPGTDEWWGRS